MADQPHGEGHGFFRSRNALVLSGFLAIGGFLLLSEHRAHVIPFLPWLLLAACPLMHLFMHGGHGDKEHGGHDHQGATDRAQGPTPGMTEHHDAR